MLLKIFCEIYKFLKGGGEIRKWTLRVLESISKDHSQMQDHSWCKFLSNEYWEATLSGSRLKHNSS